MISSSRIALVLVVLIALAATTCTSHSTNPSPTATTTTTTTTPATTTIPVSTTTTSVPAQNVFTVSGTITGNDTAKGIPGAEVEVLEGPGVGTKVTTDVNGVYLLANLTGGNYAIRARAATYELLDARFAITTSNVTLNLVMNKMTTTTTSIPVLHADFSVSPVPCTMLAAGNNCSVDGSLSTSALGITTYTWTYLGITATGIVHPLQLSCGDGPEREVHIPVTLTVTELGGATDTVTKSVTVVKTGACGF